jgi:hypothetical protein
MKAREEHLPTFQENCTSISMQSTHNKHKADLHLEKHGRISISMINLWTCTLNASSLLVPEHSSILLSTAGQCFWMKRFTFNGTMPHSSVTG